MAWAGLGSRRADTAHAPQLVSDSFGVSVSSNSALRALQGVVETSRILRSLCEGEQLRDGEKSRAPRLGCASVCLVGKRLEIAHPALSLRGSGKESVRSAA